MPIPYQPCPILQTCELVDAILILSDQTFKPVHVPLDVVGVAILDGLFQVGDEGLAVLEYISIRDGPISLPMSSLISLRLSLRLKESR